MLERTEGVPGLGPEAGPEREKPYSSRIVLSIFRHGEKEKAPPEGKEGDVEVLLTAAGRKGAMESGEIFRLPEEGIAQSVAIGSPRKRAQETAAFVMAGAEEAITGEESLEELKKKLDAGRQYGSKIGVDRRLDFSTGSGEFEAEIFRVAKAGRPWLEWLIKESDELARTNREAEGTTYSRSARNIAELVAKYVRSAKRFDQLVREKNYSDTMQRFLGTHQIVGEAFLAKVIEKTRGVGERDKFVAALGGRGFDFVEGFQVEIGTPAGADEPAITVHYKEPDRNGGAVYELHEPISLKLLEEIIEEGKGFDQECGKI